MRKHDRSLPRFARPFTTMRKSEAPQSAVNWPALLVLWTIALVLVFLGR